jgi:hypothetical protein
MGISYKKKKQLVKTNLNKKINISSMVKINISYL